MSKKNWIRLKRSKIRELIYLYIFVLIRTQETVIDAGKQSQIVVDAGADCSKAIAKMTAQKKARMREHEVYSKGLWMQLYDSSSKIIKESEEKQAAFSLKKLSPSVKELGALYKRKRELIVNLIINLFIFKAETSTVNSKKSKDSISAVSYDSGRLMIIA